MYRQIVTAFLMLSFLNVTNVAAQTKAAKPDAKNPPRHKVGPKRVNGDDPHGLLGAMLAELDLNEMQESEIRRLISDNARKIRELRGSLQPSPEDVKRQSDMFKQLREARSSHNTERATQIMEELKLMREARMSVAGPVRDQIAESRRGLEKSIRAMLRTEQRSTFDRLWTQHMDPNARYAGRTRSPQALKSLVEGLRNLSSDQKRQLDQTFRDYFDAARTRAKQGDSNARRMDDPRMLTQLHDNVMRILTPEQRAMVVGLMNRNDQRRPLRPQNADAEGGADAGSQKQP